MQPMVNFQQSRASSTQWHAQLGHLSSQTVHHILHSHELPLVLNKSDVILMHVNKGRVTSCLFSVSAHVTHAPWSLFTLLYGVLPNLCKWS
jgi:hypothetical protein